MGALLSMLLAGLKAVLQILALLFKIVYNILKAFRIRLLAVYLLACLIVQLCFHTFDDVFGKAYFYVGLAACILVTLYAWAKPLREARRRKKLNRRERELEQRKDDDTPQEEKEENAPPAVHEKKPRKRERYPLYFDVEGRPDYMFAEYADRYELFKKSEHGFEYIRTDYKDGDNFD